MHAKTQGLNAAPRWRGNRDIDLAERLGFERPRNIRKIIERNFVENERPLTRSTVERVRNRHGFRDAVLDEYWLTEAEALFIAAKSRQASADTQ